MRSGRRRRAEETGPLEEAETVGHGGQSREELNTGFSAFWFCLVKPPGKETSRMTPTPNIRSKFSPLRNSL